MQHNHRSRAKNASSRNSVGAVRIFDAPLDTNEIFRTLIADEVRTGQLSPSRRRRIIQYASHLGLTAVQVGEMIESCRREAPAGDDLRERAHPFRFIPAAQSRIPTPIKIAMVVGAALLVDLIVLKWLVLP